MHPPPNQFMVIEQEDADGHAAILAAGRDPYAMVGVLAVPLVGRLGGLYLILLLAFIDIGLGQNVMIPTGPPAWGAFLPARGAISGC